MAHAGLESVVEIFETQLKWMALVWDDQARVSRLSFYNDSSKKALDAVREFLTTETAVHNGISNLASMLTKYAQGQEITFSEIELAPCSTAFQQQVRAACREVGYGQIATYGQLAERAKSPKAARAVGLCMRNNPVPIIVPCHRVVGSTGRLIGFSAGPGVLLKQQMLKLEGVNREFVS